MSFNCACVYPLGYIELAINYQPPKSTTPEMELVDILSNITIPTRGRTTQHERQQGSAYTPKPIIQSTPTDLTLADRVEQGIKGIGYNWAGGNLSSIGTIASIGSDIEVNHRPESSFISPKDFYPNNPEYKDNRIAETLQLADKLLAKGSEHTAKGREGLGTAGGVAYDILTGAGQMGADIGTAALTGVGMLPVLGTRVFGQGASEARQEGADIGQQIAYGAISAGIEIATEKLVGGLPMAEKLGMGGVADNTIKKLAQGIASSPRLAKAFTYIANMAGEGAEEMIAEILSPVAKKMTYDPNADWATMEEVLYSGLLGAGISGVMGGGVLLQGTPIETPTQTQSVMTNENIEPDIQGFQNTIDTGLNQLYSVLDSGQKNEQAINTMITNLEKVKQLVPVLSNYVDSHIVRLNNYKTIERPRTNETQQVEQTVEQDTNVPQIERNDVVDGTEQVVDDNKTIDNIIPIDELRQKEILQDSNNIVTETQQLDNVTNVTKDTEGNELTIEQQETFKDSKVKDKDGNLLVVYHGGNVEGQFDTSKGEEATQFGQGSYFTDAYGIAEEWANENNGSIGNYYLNISKLFDTSKQAEIKETPERNELEKILKDKGFTDREIGQVFTGENLAPVYYSETPFDTLRRLLNEKGNNTKKDFWQGANEANQLLRQAGYDGIIGDLYDSKQYVVFNPEQIQRVSSKDTTPQATEQPTTTETKTAEQTVEEDKYIIKKGDYVKIDGIGIGKAVSDNSVEISGKRYYRDTEDTDYSKSTAAEYWQDLQKQIKELKNIAKEKRKEAADYNKETGGMATKRKGKISMGDGRGIGFAENSVSAHHRKLLSEAKEFSDKAKELESRIDERKKQLETRVRDGINLYDKDAEEAKILGVETKKKVDEKTDTDNKEETKETWQMTKEEFKNFAFSKGKTEDWWTPVGQTQHETYVRSALLDGKDIPQSVLNEYPNLKKEIEQTQKEIEVEKQKQAKYEETDRIAKELERQKSEITLDNFMDSVKEDDIDFKRAERAYSAVSFDPDKRAKSNQQEYVNTVKNTYEELLPLAKTDEQKTILLEEMIKFKENYLKKFNALLDATSRTMSAMITGPANFPTARNQKAMETENKRRNEFLDWLDKSVPAIKKKLNNALPETERNNETLNKLKKEVDDTIASLLAIKNGSPYNPAAFRNSLKGYFERNLKNGNIEEVRQAAEYLKEQEKKQGITVFTSVNSIWKQIENAKPKEVETGIAEEVQYDGARIVVNNDIDRIQIFFDEVPSEEIRNEMKKSGWHYSKANNNAWQRKITNNAEYNAKQIVEKYFKLIQPEMQEEVKVDETTNKQTYRYYLTQRPPAPGAIPRGSKNTVSFDTKQEVDGLEAWGYVEYDKPLTDEQISDYELSENVTETKQVDNIIGMETNINGWYVKVQNYNETYSEYKIIATKGNQSEAIFVEPKYLTDQNSLEREAKRFYNNRLVDLDEQNETISEVTTTDNNGSEKDIVTEEPISETKEEQIKETKEELQDRIDKLQETGTRGLSKNETKIYNLLISNKDTDIYTLMDKMLDIPRSNADGFDSQQRYVFVKKLIEGAVKQDTFNAVTTAETKNSKGNVIKEQGLKTVTADVVTIKIPNDGTFRISPDYASVSTIINRLGVKIKSQIPKGFNNVFSKETVMLGDDYYATGGIAVKADNVLLDEIKATHERVSNTNDDIRKMENLFNKFEKNAEWKEIKNNPYLTLHNIGGKKDKGYYIEVDNKTFLYNQKYIDYLNKDGNKFYVDTNSIGIIKVENTNSETIGIIMPISDNAKHDFTDGNMYQATKQNFWSNPKQIKSKASKGGQSFIGKSNNPLIDMSRPLKKPTDIRKDITKKFGVSNTSKKFNRSKKFLGYYKIMPEVIRLRYDNDIGTVMHELGHHFDKKYSFNSLNKQLITDMINKMNPAFKNNYQKSELPGEAIAEFLRYYTTDPTTAKEFAGEFYNLFESTLDKTDLKNIQEIRSDVLRWVNAERTEKRQSTIVPLSQKKKVSERISETIKFEKANSVLFDRYAPIQEFVKTVEKLTGRKLPASLNPYMLVERTYKNNARIEGILKGQLTDTEYNPLDTDDSLQKIVDDVKGDVTPFEDYLKLKHAITLAEKNHMIYSPDVYNNVEDMRQDLEFIEQQYPQFIELSERLYDWYDKFFKAWVVDTNMLGEDSKKIYDKMRQEYPYYVPMFRVREDGSSKQASGSLTDQKTPVDRLSEKGSDKDTISPIDNIITQVSRMVNAYSKNNVMRAIVENYNTVDGLGGFIDRVPPDMEKQILSTQPIKDSLETEFEDVENIDDIINSIPDLIENYKPLTKSKDKEIVGVITKSGKRQFYQVFDKAFLNSLTNMNPTQLDATVRMIASIRRTTTALTTGLNPIFGIAFNAPKDFQQAYIFGSYKNPAEYVYEYVKALTSVIRGNDNYKTFRDIGGVYGSSMTTELRTKNDFIRRLTKYRKGQKVGAKNALSYIGELILDFNDAIETAPRLAEFNKAYKIAKNRGDSDYDATLYALSRADDVTLNFSRRGEIMNTAVGQSIPYLNAGLQGMDKLRRGLFTGEERTQTLIKSITMLTIPTILLWLAHRDDEDYEKLTKGIKDNYWILWKNPDGSFVRIPKPKDLAGIFSADFERALNAYFKEEGAGAFEGFQSTIADSLLPPVDTIFRPLIDVIGNEKWSGGKIVPMAMEYLPKTEQYDETTSRIAVELAQLIGKVAPDSNFASPKNADYVLDQYYGGLADILLPMTTPTTYVDADTLKDKYNYLAMPMAAIMKTGELIGRKFKADPSYSNDVVNDFYDLRDKTIKANNAYEDRGVLSDDVDLIAENQFKAYYKSISSMWKTIDYIDSLVNKTLPDGHKESYKKLINQSRFADSTKQKVLDDLKDNKLNRESITMLQKTIRDEIVKLADKAVKEYKANHKENNEMLR